jgi:hypothetical protein
MLNVHPQYDFTERNYSICIRLRVGMGSLRPQAAFSWDVVLWVNPRLPFFVFINSRDIVVHLCQIN